VIRVICGSKNLARPLRRYRVFARREGERPREPRYTWTVPSAKRTTAPPEGIERCIVLVVAPATDLRGSCSFVSIPVLSGAVASQLRHEASDSSTKVMAPFLGPQSADHLTDKLLIEKPAI